MWQFKNLLVVELEKIITPQMNFIALRVPQSSTET